MGLPEVAVTTLEPVVVVVYLVRLILLMEVREGVQAEVGLGDVEEAEVRTEAGVRVFLVVVVEVSRRALWIALFVPIVRLQVQLLLRKRGESVGAGVEVTEKSLGKEELRRLDPGLLLIVTVTNFLVLINNVSDFRAL